MNETNWLIELGPYAVVVVFAVYIILRDFGFIKGRGNERRKSSIESESHLQNSAVTRKKVTNIEIIAYDIQRKTNDLYKWHDQRDEDGAFTWYVRKSLETAITRLADNIADQTKQGALQTQALLNLASKIESIDEDVKDIKDKVA